MTVLPTRIVSGFAACSYRLLVVLSFTLLTGVNIRAASATATAPTSAELEKHVDALVAQLSLDEKISLLAGVRRFHVPGVARLGLPELNLADGPVGVRDREPSTAYPATTCLAATWDRDLAEAFGASLGRDARARGFHVLLAPGVNIIRVPVDGRNFEYLSEDPFLAGSLAARIVRGIQSQGVAATPKHFVANNQETHRMSLNAVVSKRALHEIYFPAFKSAVQDGGAWMVMSAYNQLNGTYCTANRWLNEIVLKREWGFPGVLVSDWGAAHDTRGIVFGGLDLEMPGPRYTWPETLRPMIDSGEIPLAVIDDKVRRLVRMELALGFPGRTSESSPLQELDAASSEIALRVAREGIVLLKNAGHALPLDPRRDKHIAMLGPNADHVPYAGGSGLVNPWRETNVLDAMRTLAPDDVTIDLVGTSSSRSFDELRETTHYHGPLRLSYRRASFAPVVLAETSTNAIDIDWTDTSVPDGVDPHRFYAEWHGRITPRTSGLHLFNLRTIGRGANVSIDGQIVVATGSADHLQVAQGGLELEAGQDYELTATYTRGPGQEAKMSLAWGPGATDLTAEEAARVQNADAVVLCVGFDAPTEGEGADRSYALPALQAQLIQKAVALNSRVIVLLNAGASVDAGSWIDSVAALLHTWYPGQEGARAAAEILWGMRSPSGKLPVTWAKAWNDIGAAAHFPGSDERVVYSEDVLVGYRWFDTKDIQPLFPFGHGLSYTSFAYGALSIKGPDSAGWIEARFTIANRGPIPGDEIAQLYVAPPPSPVERPRQELKGLSRVSLSPGEEQTISIRFNTSDLRWFDEQTDAWRATPGEYAIRVGASSRDIRLEATITAP